MRLEGAADEADRGRSGAVPLEASDARAHDLGMRCQAEVVVRGEHDHLTPPGHLHDGALRRFEGEEALVGTRVAQRVELSSQLLGQGGVHASGSVRLEDDLAGRARLEERERFLVALERHARGDQRGQVDDAVLEEPARRVPRLPDLATVDRRHRQVLEDQRLGDVDRRRTCGNPEEDDVAAVAHDAERVLDRLQGAGHLEDDTHAHSLVLLSEPGGDVLDLANVDDRIRAEPARQVEAIGDVVRCEQPSGPERPRDGDREEPDRPAAEDRDRTSCEILRRRCEDGVAERLLEARDVRGQLRAVVLPDHRRRDRCEVGEAPVAIDAENLRVLAHVRLPGAAVKAHAAGDVALRRHVVALRHSMHALPHSDDGAAQLVAQRQGGIDALGRPLIPALDMEIGAADARRLDADEHLVCCRCGNGELVQDEPLLGIPLPYGAHRLHGGTILPRGAFYSAQHRRTLWLSSSARHLPVRERAWAAAARA